MKIKLFAAVLAATICMASVTPQAEAGSRAAENFLSGKESGSVGSTATGDKGSGTDIIAQLLAAVKGGGSVKDMSSMTASDEGTVKNGSADTKVTDKKKRPNHLELVMVIDQSGSMSGLEDDTIGGFNSMIAQQKHDDIDVNVTAVVFNDLSKTIYDREKLGNVTKMTDNDYHPGGMTALMDAIGTTIAKVEKYPEITNKDNKVLFVIITDGQENDSKEYTKDIIKKMISNKQEKDGWEFVYLGANIDALTEARSIGVKEENAVKYKNTGDGVRSNYKAVAELAGDIVADNFEKSKWKNNLVKDD